MKIKPIIEEICDFSTTKPPPLTSYYGNYRNQSFSLASQGKRFPRTSIVTWV